MVLTHAGGTNLSVSIRRAAGVRARGYRDLNIISIDNRAAANGGVDLNVGTNLNINGTLRNAMAISDGDRQRMRPIPAPAGSACRPHRSPQYFGRSEYQRSVIAGNGGAISIFSTGAVRQNTIAAAGLQSIPATGSDAKVR